MPAFVVNRSGKWRVVHRRAGVVLVIKRGGSAVDGGGHGSKEAAAKQARAINANRGAK